MFYDRGTDYFLIDHCVPLPSSKRGSGSAGMEAATESTNPLSPIKLGGSTCFSVCYTTKDAIAHADPAARMPFPVVRSWRAGPKEDGCPRCLGRPRLILVCQTRVCLLAARMQPM
jgi:hypothetical protein